jgi:pimeloyl-ACP methyl ester carboxylesterase
MPTALRPAGFVERTVWSSGVRLRCVTCGPAEGPLVLFLHGFPAHWSTWRGILPAFAQAGHLAVAPDLRGYGASDRPHGVDAYSMLRVVEDVIAILDAFGRERAFVVGHDFGGGVAWAVAMAHPLRVERLAILNSVHPSASSGRSANGLSCRRAGTSFSFSCRGSRSGGSPAAIFVSFIGRSGPTGSPKTSFAIYSKGYVPRGRFTPRSTGTARVFATSRASASRQRGSIFRRS